MMYSLRLLVAAGILVFGAMGCALLGYDSLLLSEEGTGGKKDPDASTHNSGGNASTGGVVVGSTGGSVNSGDASMVTGGSDAGIDIPATDGAVIVGIVDPPTVDSGVSVIPDASVPDASMPDAGPVDASLPPNPVDGSLVHRYSFSPSTEGSNVLEDLVGGAHGKLQGGASFNGSGQLVLDGSSGFVDLPDGLVSPLSNATFVVWFSYGGGSCGQRVFDFGSDASDFSLNPRNCLPLPAQYASQQDAAVLSYIENGVASLYLGPTTLNSGSYMMAIVIDADAMTLNWYVDGTLVNTNQLIFSLGTINDVNNWLGRSNTTTDPYLDGSLDEFRIYNVALTEAELTTILNAGPDTLP